MKKVFFITRTYLPIENGASLMRVGTVKYLEQHGFDVTVVTPNYNKHDIVIDKNVVYYPFTFPTFVGLVLEKAGLFDDYMDRWIINVYNYLIGRTSFISIISFLGNCITRNKC